MRGHKWIRRLPWHRAFGTQTIAHTTFLRVCVRERWRMIRAWPLTIWHCGRCHCANGNAPLPGRRITEPRFCAWRDWGLCDRHPQFISVALLVFQLLTISYGNCRRSPAKHFGTPNITSHCLWCFGALLGKRRLDLRNFNFDAVALFVSELKLSSLDTLAILTSQVQSFVFTREAVNTQ